ncbi:MAG TPA: biotin/lipoyl-containing protein [Polyangiaceae bacterium]|nr:biotin/lipoyl-containing protein [Polyangiaceae bacterium]
MLHYINLNGREFALTLHHRSTTGPLRLEGSTGELAVEVLSHPDSGRPALVLVDGCVYRVRAAARPSLPPSGSEPRRALINGQPLTLSIENELERRARPNRNKAAAGVSQITAPMPGRVVKVNVRPGDVVAVGAPLLGIEAMKMENELSSPSAGRVTKVTVQVGATVEADQELVVIEPA